MNFNERSKRACVRISEKFFLPPLRPRLHLLFETGLRNFLFIQLPFCRLGR